MRRGIKHILLQGATGSGKSVMASSMTASALSKGFSVMLTVPRRELIRQMSLTFEEFDIPHSIIAAGYEFNPYAKVQIASVGTLINRLDKVRAPTILFSDEVHFGGDGLDRVINHYKAQGSYAVGLSATPMKMSGQGLGCYYQTMVQGPTVSELIAMKRLSEYKLFSPDTPDLSGIRMIAGDYHKGQLSEKMEQDRVLIGNSVRHYKDHALGKLNISYCVSIKHSQIVAESFRNSGIPAMHIDGETSDDERKRIIKAFARREILVLTNCSLLTFGFDLASQANMDVTVECMTDQAPTKSLPLQQQKWGRPLRYKDYPALIFDHAGNSGQRGHGFPCSDRHWTLADQDRKARAEAEREIKTRDCDKCYFTHKPKPVCPNCGHVYPINSREIEELEGELKLVDTENIKKKRRVEQGMARTVDQLVDGFIADGMPYQTAIKRAAHIITAREAKRRK